MARRWANQQAALRRLNEARKQAHPDRPDADRFGVRARSRNAQTNPATPASKPTGVTPNDADVLRYDTRQILARATTGVADRRTSNLIAPFKWTEVSSSRLTRAGYNDEMQELRVVWKNRPGELWSYFDVPPQVHQLFITSESPGRFVNEVLNGYAYSRIQ